VSATVPHDLPLEGRAVLVADDQDEVCEMLVDYLGHLGARVEAVTDGHAALEHLRRSSFDAIVTDLRMPGFDGGSLIASARQIDPRLVVIVMTGYASFDSALAVVQLGAHEYLRKPFDLAEVHRALSSGLASRENRPIAPELTHTLSMEYTLPKGEAEGAADATASLISRLTALAWEVPTRALDGAGLLGGVQRAATACADGLRAQIDPRGVRVWSATDSEHPIYEFERPIRAA
jgi:DNA-binding NtrC family response regulator